MQSNLQRDGVDLAFETDLLYIDVVNGRIGIGTSSPGAYKLDVNGTARFRDDVLINGDLTVDGTTTTIDSRNLVVEDNILLLNQNTTGGTGTDSGIMINRGAGNDSAVIYWDETLDRFRVGTTTDDGSSRDLSSVTLAKFQAADPAGDDDLVTKRYFDANVSGAVDGTQIDLGSVADGSWADGAYHGFTTARSVTDAIDDLNETMENIRENTYVQTVTFVSDSTSISLGDPVTLTITTVGGGADRYTITWGDGTQTVATTDSTPSHTYNESSGSPMTVTVKAFASGAVTDSAGSFAESTRSNYITVAGAAPVVGFNIKSASSDGSTITFADSGDTVYLENTTTNTVSDNTFEVDWGDGNTDAIANDSADGGASGSRLAHTYTNSAADDGSTIAGTGAGDTKYRIRLTLLTH